MSVEFSAMQDARPTLPSFRRPPAGGPPRQLIDRNKLTSEGGPSRLLLAGWGFSSGNLLTTRVKPKHPPGQNQPGWATHNIRRPSQSNHPTQSNVSRVTAPSLPEPLT